MAEGARPRGRALTDAERWRLLDDLYQRVLFRSVRADAPETAEGRVADARATRPSEIRKDKAGATNTSLNVRIHHPRPE